MSLKSMNNNKHVTVGALVVIVAAIVVIGGLAYWAFQGNGKPVNEEVSPALISFNLADKTLVATSTGLEKVDAKYLPPGETTDQLIGTMALVSTDSNGVEMWSLDLPTEAIVVQKVTAYGYDALNKQTDTLILSADDIATLRTLWFQVPTTNVALAVGASRTVDGITIKLDDVLEDSRCPQNVTCVWAGQVRVQVELSIKDEKNQTVVLSTAGQGVSFANHFISILSITPAMVSDKIIPKKDYEITFAVAQDIKG